MVPFEKRGFVQEHPIRQKGRDKAPLTPKSQKGSVSFAFKVCSTGNNLVYLETVLTRKFTEIVREVPVYGR
jgi:hypothetical protein